MEAEVWEELRQTLSGDEEAPVVIKSVYNRGIVGCPGGEGEDEHDVFWLWLAKDKPHECPVCEQYFVIAAGVAAILVQKVAQSQGSSI